MLWETSRWLEAHAGFGRADDDDEGPPIMATPAVTESE
jgi:hypothetical protein